MELTHIDVDTFTDKELVKVFNYVATKVIKKTPFKAKRQLRIKKGEKLNWGHVIKILEMYGVPVKMSFSFDEKTAINPWRCGASTTIV